MIRINKRIVINEKMKKKKVSCTRNHVSCIKLGINVHIKNNTKSYEINTVMLLKDISGYCLTVGVPNRLIKTGIKKEDYV